MARKEVDWHWPRTALADHYLRMFTVVKSHSMVLFAPRGKGKTEFMTQDVVPQAVKQGFFPVYVNFWDDQSNPSASLRYALLRASSEAGLQTKLRDTLSRTGLDVSIGLNIGVANVNMKTKTEARPKDEIAHFEMRQIADGLMKCSGKSILFIFDEVQTLASKPEHEDFVRSLRTMLDERRGTVASIFTGSSQTRLVEMFARLKAPLYNFAKQVDFPPLEDPFLQHWMSNIKEIMGDDASLTLDKMRHGFAMTDKNPRIFWSAVLGMIQANSVDIELHAKKAADETSDMAGVRQRMQELTPLDRLVLRSVIFTTQEARQSDRVVETQLFSKEARDVMGAELGLTPTPSQVQGSLRRLMSDDMQLVVSKARGHYEIEDAFFLTLMEEVLLPFETESALRLATPALPPVEDEPTPDDAPAPPRRPRP